MSPRESNVPLQLVVGAFMIALGSMFALAAHDERAQAYEALSWRPVEVTVIRAEVVRDRGQNSHARLEVWARTDEGRALDCRLFFGKVATQADMQRATEEFPPGARREVYPDPAQPGRAVLYRAAPSASTYAVAALGALVALLGAGVLGLGVRNLIRVLARRRGDRDGVAASR